MSIDNSDSLEFPPFGFMDCQKLNAILGTSKDPEVFDGKASFAVTLGKIRRHAVCGVHESRALRRRTKLSPHKRVRESFGCELEPSNSERGILSRHGCDLKDLANRNAPFVREDISSWLPREFREYMEHGSLHGHGDVRFRTLQVSTHWLREPRE